MTAKEFLQKIRSERLEIEQLADQIDELKYSLLPSGIQYDAIKVQTSPDDKMLRIAEKIDEYERQIRKHLEELVSRQNTAFVYIGMLDKSEHRQVLTLYYLSASRLTWGQVAEKMVYSDQRIYQLHNDAISELETFWTE